MIQTQKLFEIIKNPTKKRIINKVKRFEEDRAHYNLRGRFLNAKDVQQHLHTIISNLNIALQVCHVPAYIHEISTKSLRHYRLFNRISGNRAEVPIYLAMKCTRRNRFRSDVCI